MADALMTASGDLSAIVPQIWSQKFTQNLRAALPWIDSVARDYEGEIAQIGDRVFIPTLPDGSVASLVLEGAQSDAQAVTATTTPLIINKQAVWDFNVTNIAQLQSIPFMDRMRDMAINAIMQRMQNEIIGAVVPSASSPDHTIAYVSGTTLAHADILAAKRLLDNQNVPDDGRVLISGTNQANDLLNVINFVNSQYRDAGMAAPSATGAVNQGLLGFQPKKTTANGNVTYAFHRSFLQMAVQRSLSIKIYDMGVVGQRSYRVNVDLLFGLVQNFNTRVVTIS